MKQSEQIKRKLENKLLVMHEQYQQYAATRQECSQLQRRLETAQRNELAAQREQHIQAEILNMLKNPELANQIARLAASSK